MKAPTMTAVSDFRQEGFAARLPPHPQPLSPMGEGGRVPAGAVVEASIVIEKPLSPWGERGWGEGENPVA